MLRLLEKFLRRTEGQVSVIFALASVPLLLAAGAAIDRVRADNVRTEMHSALDGAALAAAMAGGKTNAQREKMARDYFKANFPYANEFEVNFSINVTATKVVAKGSFEYPTAFMHLAGIRSSRLDIESEVMMPTNGTAEVVLVLDYSGSMNSQNKVGRMAKAASDMVTSLDQSIPDGKLKFGLVPFSAMVYTTLPAAHTIHSVSTPTWTGCTQDRGYPHNITVDTPTSDPATKWGYFDGNENRGDRNCAAYDNKKLSILPLTTDMDAVKDKLDRMKPLGNTNIPLGAEFGWNLLDPQAPFEEALPYADPDNRKFLVLLTDGVQTSKHAGENGERTVQHGISNLPKLCQGMAEKGITVFTIAYDIKDPLVTNMLKACSGERYYEPDASGSEINNVFSAITKDIKSSTIRLAR
jgi:Flp pilus assembly protein TadG